MYSRTYSEPYKTSKMKLFAKMNSRCKLLTTSAKSSILDVWQSSEYAEGVLCQNATGLSKKVQQFKKIHFVIKVQAIPP